MNWADETISAMPQEAVAAVANPNIAGKHARVEAKARQAEFSRRGRDDANEQLERLSPRANRQLCLAPPPRQRQASRPKES